MGHHRTRFARIQDLMPLRRFLAEAMFAITALRSDLGVKVLVALIQLYQQDTEVEFRPGLEPEKCCCPRKHSQERYVVPEVLPLGTPLLTLHPTVDQPPKNGSTSTAATESI